MSDPSSSSQDSDAPQPKADSVRVAVRVRPLNAREKSHATAARFSWKIDDSSVAQCDNDKVVQPNIYSFDNVFGQQSTNSQIFDTVAAPVVKSAVDGINGVIFAYGQTAAGKTYTMLGTDADPGVTRRAIAAVFERVGTEQNRQFLLRASYIEIYNEVIRDLLVPANDNLKIHEDVFNKRVFVDAREEVVTSIEEVMNIIAAGETARAVGETNMNERSSRSHTIFSLKIESREMDEEPERDTLGVQNDGVAVRASTLSLVDLAGSERASFTKAQGMRLVEGGHINKSLLTLGTVINKLSSGVSQNSSHIPYRDSKLTRLLQPALGGNARTAIICAVTPAILHMDETISTLKFASRAKKVTNMAKTNEYLDDRAKLRKAEKQITVLRGELQRLRESCPPRVSTVYPERSSTGSADGDAERRMRSFQKKFEKLLKHISTAQSAGSNPGRAPHVNTRSRDKGRPSLVSALDLNSGKLSVRNLENHNGATETVIAQLRKNIFDVEREKRQALAEIEYERQAMCAEVEHLVATGEEATLGRITAEEECEEAMSMLAKAQARSLVDEIVSEAMTTSLVSKDLRTAQRDLLKMEAISKENNSVKERLAALRKDHAEVVRREKRGIGPVLKEAKLAQNKLHDAENKLKSARQAAQKMTSERASLDREVKERDRKIKALSSEIERHRKHGEKVHHRISKEVAEEKKKFDAVFSKTREELSVASSRTQKLEYELLSASKKAEELETELASCFKEHEQMLSARDTKIQQLGDELCRRDQDRMGLLSASQAQKAELDSRQTLITTLEHERDSLEAVVAKLDSTHLSSSQENVRLTEELGQVHLDLEEVKSESEALVKNLAEAKEREKSLRSSLEDSESRYILAVKAGDVLQVTVEQDKDSLIAAQREIADLQARASRLEKELTEAEESGESIKEKLVSQHETIETAAKRVTELEELVGNETRITSTLRESLKSSVQNERRLEEELGAMTIRHDQLLRNVEDLERPQAGLTMDCSKCDHLATELSAAQEACRKLESSENARHPLSGAEMERENDKLNDSVEQLAAEAVTRTREVLRLTETLRSRDEKLFNLEQTLDSIRRGDGVVARLEDRVRRRDTQIGELNRRLNVQTELLKKGSLEERFLEVERVCAIESENDELREAKKSMEDRIRSLEKEREEVREETFKLRDKIKERDCRRIEKVVGRKEERLKDVKESNRRKAALREVSVNRLDS